MANSKKPKMQEVKEAGTPGKNTNYWRAQREAAEELRKREEEELHQQKRSEEMGEEEGMKEGKREKEETAEREKEEKKRRSLKSATPKKKTEKVKTPLRSQAELAPTEVGAKERRSEIPLFPQTPVAEGRVANSPKPPSPTSSASPIPPPTKLPVSLGENRLEARMVNGRWCAMVNGGWVELGFREERPHQITPISLPAKQVLSQNQYWELDSLEDPPRGGDPHPHQGQVTPTGQLMTAAPQRADTRTDPYDPGNRSQGRDNNPQPLRRTLASRVETPKSVKEEVKLLFPSMTMGMMDWPKAIQCMRGQVASGKWEDTPSTASTIAAVLVGGDNPLTQVRPTNNTSVTKYLDALYETMVPHGKKVPIARAADFQLSQSVPLIQQYANYKMIFNAMEPALRDELFVNNVLNCSDLAQLWRVESTRLLIPGEPINVAQVCKIVDRQSKGLLKGPKTPSMTELLAMNAGPGYYNQEPPLNTNWPHQTSPHQASPQYQDARCETPPSHPPMADRQASRKKREPALPSRSCKACKEMHWMPDCPYIKQAQARGGIHYRKDRRGMGKHCMCCGHNNDHHSVQCPFLCPNGQRPPGLVGARIPGPPRNQGNNREPPRGLYNMEPVQPPAQNSGNRVKNKGQRDELLRILGSLLEWLDKMEQKNE